MGIGAGGVADLLQERDMRRRVTHTRGETTWSYCATGDDESASRSSLERLHALDGVVVDLVERCARALLTVGAAAGR